MQELLISSKSKFSMKKRENQRSGRSLSWQNFWRLRDPMSRFEFSFNQIWKEDIFPWMKALTLPFPFLVPLRKLITQTTFKSFLFHNLFWTTGFGIIHFLSFHFVRKQEVKTFFIHHILTFIIVKKRKVQIKVNFHKGRRKLDTISKPFWLGDLSFPISDRTLINSIFTILLRTWSWH